MKENLAVIQLGGSQHIVRVGDFIKVNKLNIEVGKSTKIEEVLLYTDGEKVEIGDPYVPYVVEITVESEGKDKKIDILKYKAKSRYRKSIGHRQPISIVKVTKITKKSAK